MRKLVLSLLAAGTVLAVATPALARDGCGRGYHRVYKAVACPIAATASMSIAVRRMSSAAGVRLVIGNYYPNRGYWDGRRYYQNRYRWNGGWRYR